MCWPRCCRRILALVFCFCLMPCFVRSQDQATARRAHYVSFDNNVPAIYTKWLTEDVRWIITDQERADFETLATDKQRDEFVVAFWERRNPIAGSSKNRFKEAHYQRLAYANQHFAAGVPGWKADRGRIYVVYGPPDEIEHHLQGTLQPSNTLESTRYPYEVWRYHNMKGVGRDVSVKFVDTCECGEYHVTVDPSGKHPPSDKE